MKFERVCNKLLLIFLLMTFGFLTVMAFAFSQRCGIEALEEIANGAPIYQITDSPVYHIVGCIFVAVIFIAIRTVGIRYPLSGGKKKYIFACQAAVSVFAVIFSLCLLCGGQRTPVDDQVQVYSAAALFNQGNFINLEKGGYLNMYPQQLGYVAYLQIIFWVFGNGNFFVVQVLNCFFIGGIVFLYCKYLNELTVDENVRLGGTLFIAPFLPLYLLNSWVYGDIPCFFFLFLFCLLFFKFCKDIKWKFSIGMVFAISMSLLFRKNSLIIIIGAVIALLFFFSVKKRKEVLANAVCIVIFPLAVICTLEYGYEKVSGYEIDGGLPSIMWIAMGITEDASKPGWFHNFSVPAYYSVDCDREAAAEIGKQQIRARLEYFKENPVYAVSFYKRKLCTQWNDPFYNTNVLTRVDGGTEPKGITAILAEHEKIVFQILSVYQFLVYAGVIIYCILKGRKNYVYENIILIIFTGGFLFSILWEGNSRYVLPYVLLLIPLSAVGWAEGVMRLKRKVNLF